MLIRTQSADLSLLKERPKITRRSCTFSAIEPWGYPARNQRPCCGILKK